MREVLSRVRRVLISSEPSAGPRRFTAALLMAGLALPWLPLASLPGYELGAALALLHGLLGGLLGLAFARAEPPEAPDLPRAIAAATLVLWALLVPPFLVAAARTLVTTPCDPFATSGFFPLLTLPSSFLAAALGALVGRLTRRRWTAGLVWVAVLLAAVVHAGWPVVFGPQVYVYSHLGGYLPGPIYDEALAVTPSLWWFRLGTVALALAVTAALSSWPRRRVVAGSFGALFLLLEALGPQLGFRMSDAALMAQLSVERRAPGLVVHASPNLERADLDQAVDDARFRLAQVSRFLGGAPPGEVTVWLYASPEQKQLLVGALHTQFSKPWRREVHVDAATFPHPVLKHELVHALSAAWGPWPFRVTGAVLPLMGIVEGLAVAADNPVDDLRLHEWAAAMKRRHLLPDVRSLLAPQGFYDAPAARAYTTAGSFMRWLVDTHGAQRVRVLYANGDFQRAYGTSLDALASDYERFLDSVEVDEAAANQALGRFQRGSIFERPCAREVAQLERAVGGASAERALELARRCRALQPLDHAHQLREARALKRLGREAEARERYDEVVRAARGEPTTWGDAALERALLAWRDGELPAARALLEDLTQAQVSPAFERTARLALAALALPDGPRRAVLRAVDASGDRVVTYLLRDSGSDAWPVTYLLGRRLAQAGEHAEALRWLERTLAVPADELPQSARREATRVAVEAAFFVRDCSKVAALVDHAELGPIFAARAADWVERCEFLASPRDR